MSSLQPQINIARLEKLLDDFAQIGKTKNGGVTRLTLTSLDKQARDLLIQISQSAGFKVRVDAIGNIFIRRKGLKDLPVVMTGSHGDSQPKGGRYDGIYGVLAGLEVLLTLNDYNIQTNHPIELVMWTNEEGSRFAPAMMGSAVFTGKLDLKQAYAIKDQDGITVKQALEDIGYLGNTKIANHSIKAIIEVHIEQGPILEQQNQTIGIVKGAFAQRWYEVTLTGLAAHAGTTPVNMRQDAVVGLSESVTALNRLALHPDSKDIRLTVGMITVSPNSRNVVADHCFFTIDLRHYDSELLANFETLIYAQLSEIAEKLNLKLEIKKVLSMPSIHFEPNCIASVRKAAIKNNYSAIEMVSGAGHDACHLSSIAPTSMIFIPCIKGISHNEAESITTSWCKAGADVLLDTLLELSQ
ncbi:M20 family metallo-hydrolase [Gilliamella apis]|uniref:M20 family metallo-hydrolase n=1 Tax=Gilliamella apis TaxID=1970738 RepID=UPI0027421952|nr:M20 family metallo-hydrolase [Gilliamella apis]WLT05674.1 M20 family metallo-hydrolase [Gilliamella apis]